MLKLFFPVAALAVLDIPAQAQRIEALQPHIEFSPFKEGVGHDLSFRLGPQLKWTALARSPYACIIPEKRAVFYTHSFPLLRRVTLRTFEGKILWANAESPPEYDDYHDLVAGGDSILGASDSPTFRDNNINDPKSWTDYLKASPVTLLSLKNGNILWESNRQEIGFPIWSNGQVFFALRWSTPKGSDRIRVYIEERNISDRKCVWKAPLRGLPPLQLRVSPGTRGHARLVFTGGPRQPRASFLKPLSQLDITVPVHRGAVLPAHLQPKYIEGKAD
ncbi:hypothetical protein EON80_11975 [bacterium]|nr:MAG: hypothetical protein EON80_11975 [bacterium]